MPFKYFPQILANIFWKLQEEQQWFLFFFNLFSLLISKGDVKPESFAWGLSLLGTEGACSY